MNAPVKFSIEGGVLKPKKRPRWETIAGLCLLNGYRKGAELGVSKGRFTIFQCATIHDMEMLAVDLWAPQPDNLAPGAQTYNTWDHEASYSDFKAVCEQWFPGRVKIVRSDTVEAAKDVPDGSLDFVFIDADHSYRGCKRDIEAWSSKVRRGGMISGHDYHPQKWPGVVKAVDEAFAKKATFPDMVWAHFKTGES